LIKGLDQHNSENVVCMVFVFSVSVNMKYVGGRRNKGVKVGVCIMISKTNCICVALKNKINYLYDYDCNCNVLLQKLLATKVLCLCLSESHLSL